VIAWAIAGAPVQESTVQSRLYRFLQLAAIVAACSAPVASAWSQAYPARPVHVLVGFPGGSSQDIVARILGQWLSERLGQPFIIDNRPGAGGNIAVETVVNAPCS
jgi:tripartite-type tricarboxylate transporter receptor subunit TctC